MNKTSSAKLAVLLIGTALLFLTGCQTYSKKTEGLSTTYHAGNLPAAVKEADALAKKNDKSEKDSIIYHLEHGAILRAAAGDPVLGPGAAQEHIRQSNAAFDRAEARINKYEEAAKVKVGSEAGAMITNLANLPYRGRSYDKIMLNTYKALNYMQLGELEPARVELNRVYQRQAAAVEENARRIAQNQADIEKTKSGATTGGKGFDMAGIAAQLDNPDAQSKLNTAASDAVIGAYPYADYVNPFSELLNAIFLSTCAADADDMERARKSFERVSQMAPDNSFAKQDLADVTAGAPASGITYVIYEGGSAPGREEVKFTLPVSLVFAASVPSISVAYPRLVFHDKKSPVVTIAAEGAQTRPELVCSMDSVIARDFKNEWPVILTKTIASSVAKAALDAGAQAAVKKVAGNSMYGKLIQAGAKLTTLAANHALTIADTRQWRSLPKEFYYARIPTPASRAISIDGNQINLIPGEVTVVYIKNIGPGTPSLISQFKLKGRAAMAGSTMQ